MLVQCAEVSSGALDVWNDYYNYNYSAKWSFRSYRSHAVSVVETSSVLLLRSVYIYVCLRKRSCYLLIQNSHAMQPGTECSVGQRHLPERRRSFRVRRLYLSTDQVRIHSVNTAVIPSVRLSIHPSIHSFIQSIHPSQSINPFIHHLPHKFIHLSFPVSFLSERLFIHSFAH